MAAFRPRLVPTLIALPLLLTLLGLGTWQVQRLQWKQALIDERDAALAQPPLTLTSSTSPGALRFRRAEATGTFLHERELHLGPRVHDGKAGLHALTPLRLADGGLLLVNRGWVPEAARDPGTRPDGQVGGEVTVTGVVMAYGPPNAFTPDNDATANTWYTIDLDAMSRAVGAPLLPVVLAADATPVPGGLPVGGQGRPELRNQHLQYAITWYALAVALVVIYVLFHRRRYGG
jgi:surfeit locus 1 family protein